MQKWAVDGNILPPYLRNFSRAITYVSSILSFSKKVPNGSLTMMSIFLPMRSSGISSIFDWITSII